MQISRHCNIEKDFKDLKRFSTPKESLESWERLFCLKGIKETPGIDIFSEPIVQTSQAGSGAMRDNS